jgi:uncharacterized membrane protein
MTDIIAILGIIIGVILFIIAKKKPNFKVLYIIGLLIILISLAIGAPDFIKGFRNGFSAGFHS